MLRPKTKVGVVRMLTDTHQGWIGLGMEKQHIQMLQVGFEPVSSHRKPGALLLCLLHSYRPCKLIEYNNKAQM